MLTTQTGEKHAQDKRRIVKIRKAEGTLSFISLKNHRLPLQAKGKKKSFILNNKTGHQKSIIAARSICLRRRLQPGVQQPPDLSGVVPHLPAAPALLAAALKCFLANWCPTNGYSVPVWLYTISIHVNLCSLPCRHVGRPPSPLLPRGRQALSKHLPLLCWDPRRFFSCENPRQQLGALPALDACSSVRQ
ncbi:uncharacterized protein LOC111931109 isoform X2 [Cyanistes caeruleus]|uniref:uncharacterized protein LOC111931109 isoform X2 n=1 Tax=Cyanistes caeruleus TaxID=156563 RepID=UPI000CDB4752|nr:uncharacterized protein LOC111931109 isoform X2 [Cyanistes caeruleus]